MGFRLKKRVRGVGVKLAEKPANEAAEEPAIVDVESAWSDVSASSFILFFFYTC